MGRSAGYRRPRPDEVATAERWWDANAAEYYAEHGATLGDDELLWCPEGLTEAEAGLLGPVAGSLVLEVGAGAAQGGRWCAGQGARVVSSDVSAGMLAQGRRLNAASGTPVPLVQADARALPFADAAFDVAFTAFGALPFVAETATVHREVARVLRPGGRWVFSVTHPLRWAFPDDPGAGGLTAVRSYFDRFGGVRDYLSGVVEEARRTGWTATLLGRRRYLPDLTSDNRQRREMAERMALNAPIQGSAADLIKVAMLGVDAGLREQGLASRMLLQVHDELVMEVAPGERDAVEALVRAQMAAAADLLVPLDVSVGTGSSWHDAGH